MIGGIAATAALAVPGIAATRLAYGKGRHRRGWATLGALLISGALGVAATMLPADAGVPVWLGVVSIAGFWAAWVGTPRANTGRRQDRTGITGTKAKIGDNHGLRFRALDVWPFLAALVLGLAASLIWMICLSLALPLPDVDRPLLSVTLWPFAAAGAVMYLYAARRRRRAFLVIFASALAAAGATAAIWLS
jgi:hypothetical protein